MSEEKREALAAMLDRSLTSIVIVPSRDGVDVPDHLRAKVPLVLNLSLRFGSKLTLTTWGIHADLRFDGAWHDCKIPWDAVFAMARGDESNPHDWENRFWVESMPTEEERVATKVATKQRGGLRLV
jgi:stringent starvation protein B